MGRAVLSRSRIQRVPQQVFLQGLFPALSLALPGRPPCMPLASPEGMCTSGLARVILSVLRPWCWSKGPPRSYATVPENVLACWFCAFLTEPGKSREFLPAAENSNAFTSCLCCKLLFHLDNSRCNSRNFSDLGLGLCGEGG